MIILGATFYMQALHQKLVFLQVITPISKSKNSENHKLFRPVSTRLATVSSCETFPQQ